MTTVTEGRLELAFDEGCSVTKYDESDFYRYFQGINGIKALDVVCVKDSISWLIEITDYRNASEPKKITANVLICEVVQKTVDTIAGLAVATVNRQNDIHKIAASALRANQFRVVFHLEGLDRLNKDLQSGLLIRLRQRLKYIDKSTAVVSAESLSEKMPWAVKEI